MKYLFALATGVLVTFGTHSAILGVAAVTALGCIDIAIESAVIKIKK